MIIPELPGGWEAEAADLVPLGLVHLPGLVLGHRHGVRARPPHDITLCHAVTIMSLCYWSEVFMKTGPGRWVVSQNRSIAGGWGVVTIVTRGSHNIQQMITRAAGAGHQKARVKLSSICTLI